MLPLRYTNCFTALFFLKLQTNSPLHHHRNCTEDGVENVPFDIVLCCPILTGRLRCENENVDDVEDYRSRQPSEPALWDFLSTKFPAVKGLLNLMCMKNIKRQILKSGIFERL